MNEQNVKEILRELSPQAIFTPSYPQVFKFDLIINSKNYGELEIRIEEGLKISEVRASKTVLNALEKIGKEHAGKTFYHSLTGGTNFVNYPFDYALDLVVVLLDKKTQFSKNKRFDEFHSFVSNTKCPINTDLLYKNTGLLVLY